MPATLYVACFRVKFTGAMCTCFHAAWALQAAAASGEAIDMEACFSQLTLDVIGKAVFNYEFNALNADSPLIQVAPRWHAARGRGACSRAGRGRLGMGDGMSRAVR